MKKKGEKGTQRHKRPIKITKKGGAIALIIAALIALIPFIHSLIFVGPSLQIIDISVIDTLEYPTIFDIKVVNKGNRVAVVKRVEFNVSNIWLLRNLYLIWGLGLPVLGEYDVVLPYKMTPYTTTLDISRSVDADEPDRFQFKLCCDSVKLQMKNNLIYKVIVKMIYGEPDKSAEYKPIIFLMQPPPWNVMSYCTGPEFGLKSHVQYNIIQLEEIVRHDKVFKSEAVKMLIKQIPVMKEWCQKFNEDILDD